MRSSPSRMARRPTHTQNVHHILPRMRRRASGLLRLQTHQPPEVWEALRLTGVFRARARLIRPSFLPAYRWIASQLRQRIGPPPRGVRFPVWAWVSWGGRPGGCRAISGEPENVHIHFDAPESGILISDYHSWHCVMGGIRLYAGDDDWQAWNDRIDASGLEFNEFYDRHWGEVVQSWDRLFDLSLGHSLELGGATFQAVLWEIRLDQVRRVTRPLRGGRRELVWRP